MIDQLLSEEYQDSVENPGYASTNRVSPIDGKREQEQHTTGDPEQENRDLLPPPAVPAGDATPSATATSSGELPESSPVSDPPVIALPSATPAEAPPAPPSPPLSESATPPESLHDEPAPATPPEVSDEPPPPAPASPAPAEPGASEPPAEVPLVGSVGEQFPVESVNPASTSEREPDPFRPPPDSISRTADQFAEEFDDWKDVRWTSDMFEDSGSDSAPQDDFGFEADLAGRMNFT